MLSSQSKRAIAAIFAVVGFSSYAQASSCTVLYSTEFGFTRPDAELSTENLSELDKFAMKVKSADIDIVVVWTYSSPEATIASRTIAGERVSAVKQYLMRLYLPLTRIETSVEKTNFNVPAQEDRLWLEAIGSNRKCLERPIHGDRE